jgi:hypothetical protein
MKIANTTIPQPFAGSWITAGALAAPATIPIVLTLGGASSSGSDATNIFIPGDFALIINADGSNAENVFITAVSGNTVTLGYKKNLQPGVVTEKTHPVGTIGTGAFILINNVYNNYYMQTEDGNTAVMYLGNAWNMTATFRRIAKLQKVTGGTQPIDTSDTENFFGNPFAASELWVLGTANDQFTPVFSQV